MGACLVSRALEAWNRMAEAWALVMEEAVAEEVANYEFRRLRPC